MPSPVEVALIGLGRMGRVHAQAIAEAVPEIRVVAVAEPRGDVVRAAERWVRDAAVYSDASAALRHPGICGCMVVTPTVTHHALVREALELGLHVFCEKPLTLDPATSVELGKFARTRRVALQVGFWRRFCSALVEAKRLLAAGAIGTPLMVRLAQWDVEGPPAAWCDPEQSGGIAVDMGIHEFDQIEWMLDTQITDVLSHPLDRADPELADVGDFDNIVVVARLANRALALIDLSRNGRYADDVRFEAIGTDGSLFVHTHPRARVDLGTRSGLKTVWSDSTSDVLLQSVAAEISVFAQQAANEPGVGIPAPGASESVRALAVGATAQRFAQSADERLRQAWAPVDEQRPNALS